MGARLGNQVAILALRFAMAIARSVKVAPCYVAWASVARLLELLHRASSDIDGARCLGSSLAKTSREAFRQAITAEAIDDKVDEDAGLGGEQCSGGIVDRDRPAIGVPLWHQSYERTLLEMRQSVRHGDERHA